jgi:hypothetical protein
MKAALPLFAALLLATPAAAQDERVWTFSESEEGVHLQYGTPESDDVLATFICQKGTDQAELYLTFEHRIATESPTADGDWLDAQGRKAPWPVDLILSGVAVTAEASADEMNGGSSVTYLGDTGGLRGVAASGQLRADAFGETIAPPPFRKADFRRFLEGCKG